MNEIYQKVKVVLVSCEDKTGLVNNEENNLLPPRGILGYFEEIEPETLFISSGGTYLLLKENNFNVKSIEEYTESPQMKNGLVKSIDFKVHASILAQENKEDIEFISSNNLLNFDVVITNFLNIYLDNIDLISNFDQLEKYRIKIDVGGPLMCMTASKAFTNTLLLTSPKDYVSVIKDMRKNFDTTTLKLRVKLMKKSSKLLTSYLKNINDLYEKINVDMIAKERGE